MTTPNSSLVTVIQFGGRWCAIKLYPDDTKQFISNPLTEERAAIAAAKRFANEHHLPYKDNALIFNKPFVTIWRSSKSWIPAKIFSDRIEGAGLTVEDKSQAIKMAKQLAAREGLECLPYIGESCFDSHS